VIWQLSHLLQCTILKFSSIFLIKFSCKPIETLVQSLPCDGAAPLHVPIVFFYLVQCKQIGDVTCVTGCWQVYFVCENQHNRVFQIVVVEQIEEFHLGQQ